MTSEHDTDTSDVPSGDLHRETQGVAESRRRAKATGGGSARSEQSTFTEGVVRAAQDYAIPRLDGPTHKDAGMLRHVIVEAMAVTDEMVERAGRALCDAENEREKRATAPYRHIPLVYEEWAKEFDEIARAVLTAGLHSS